MAWTPPLDLLIASTATVAISVAWIRASTRTPKLPYPPGPKPRPLVGNLFDIPPSKTDWLGYHELAKQYGDVVHLNLAGQHVLVVNSVDAAIDLLDRRSTVYSDRPESVMLLTVMDMKDSPIMRPYGEPWKKARRLLHQHLNPNVTPKYASLQTRHARILLQRLLEDPTNFLEHLKVSIGATTIDSMYGIEVTNHTHPFIARAEKLNKMTQDAMLPGKFWVDMLPILQYLPTWFPGATFHQHAQRFVRPHYHMLEDPVREVEADLARGSAVKSVLADMLRDSKGSDDRHFIKHTVGAVYSAGVDTTLSPVLGFVLAMTLYPEIQMKAQAELCDRLPELSDAPNLPYINAIISEALRWQPAVPLGVSHATSQDDQYNGYFIPKGTTVVGNAWAMLHNPTDYPDPEEFHPERFLGEKSARNPRDIIFGFGRRICPGRYFAKQSIFLTVSSLLAAFQITPTLDERGNPVLPEVEVENMVVSYPLPFDCVITPRSAAARALIDLPLPERGL